VALRLAEPWPLKLVFDRVLPQAGRTAGAAGLEASQVISLAAIALVAAVSLRAVASYIQTVALATVASRALTGVREALFRQMQLLPLGFHARARAGDLTVRLTNDVGMLQDVAVTALLPLLGDATILVGMTALMLWMQPGLALIACAPLPFFLFRWRRTHGRLREAARAQRAREGAMAAAAAESVSAIRTVQALSMQAPVAQATGVCTYRGECAIAVVRGARVQRQCADALAIAERGDHSASGINAFTRPRALARVSSSSRCGSESATMPAPARNSMQSAVIVRLRIRMFRSICPSAPRYPSAPV